MSADRNRDSRWQAQHGDSRSHLFETQRIKVLADEREAVQKKTFTKWVNSHLAKMTARIEDLYTDLRDGRMLMKLLETLSGEKLPKPTRGNMRIHKMENTDKALMFLKKKNVTLENIAGHDIVDGNPRLTLGLIWTIILRFQIQDISVEEEGESQAVKSAKDALLLWCQRRTAGYNNVHVTNFSTSWRDGLAFNAIIHYHRPDLIYYEGLEKTQHKINLNNAFDVAERDLGLARLLDAEDVDVDFPDEKSVITYVATYYHYFSKMKSESIGGRRIAKVIGQAMDNERSCQQYERLTSELLQWIEAKIKELDDRSFPNSLPGMQGTLASFNTYRTQEKPPKFVEKGNLEVMLFDIQTKLRANNQRTYVPPEGKMIADINKTWARLEHAEHSRELAIRHETMRLERQEQLVTRFHRKVAMREAWLTENQRLIAVDDFGDDLTAVEAATQKHEAIETDIKSYEERVTSLGELARELTDANYHSYLAIRERHDHILRMWNKLLDSLADRRERLRVATSMYKTFQEMIDLLDYMEDVKVGLVSDDYGKHLTGVEDLLQKHSLVEADISSLAERVKQLTNQAQEYGDMTDDFPDDDDSFCPEPQLIAERQATLNQSYAQLQDLAAARRERLEASQVLQRFYVDADEEESWIREQEQILIKTEQPKDLTSVRHLQQKQQGLETATVGHEGRVQDVVSQANQLLLAGHYDAANIKAKVTSVEKNWSGYKSLAATKRDRLNQLGILYQYLADSQETINWMKMMEQVVTSPDYGRDQYHTQALIKKHEDVEEELRAYEKVMSGLQIQHAELAAEDRVETVAELQPQIMEQYQHLLELSSQRKATLLEVLLFHEFVREVGLVELWIRDKKAMILSLRDPSNLEEAESIKQRLAGAEQEVMGGEAQVIQVNNRADELVQARHRHSVDIVAKKEGVNEEWEDLISLLQRRRAEIEASGGVHELYSTVEQTVRWINEKAALIQQSDPHGKDLETVLKEQRQLQATERDLVALADKIQALNTQADQLTGQHPDKADVIRTRVEELNRLWKGLNEEMEKRRALLGESGSLQAYLLDLMSFQTWLLDALARTSSQDHPNSVARAEEMLKEHQELRTEMTTYDPTYSKIVATGKKVITDPADSKQQEAEKRLNDVETSWTKLWDTWENRQELLVQCLTYETFKRDAEHTEVLLLEDDKYLEDENIGNTLDEAEGLIKKHEEFEKKLAAHDENVNTVQMMAERLMEDEHYAKENVEQTAKRVCEKQVQNRERSGKRRSDLENSLRLHRFRRDCDELEVWIAQKMQTACDESYRDSTNLASKQKRHEAFEAELDANRQQLDDLLETGQVLAATQPESGEEINGRLDNLQKQWKLLRSKAAERGICLRQGNSQEQFNRAVDDMMSWLNQTETSLLTDDLGKDIPSVGSLLKKHQMLESEVVAQKQEVEKLCSEADNMLDEDHFDSAAVKAKKNDLEQRYASIARPMTRRRSRLEKSKKLHHFNRDVDEELAWIREKMLLATSTDYGNDFLGTQRLLKRHKALVGEVGGHEPMIAAVCHAADRLVSEGHEESQQISNRKVELQERWHELNDAVAGRQEKLELSAVAQQYFLDAAEAEAWMSEQELYMMDDDRGRDEASASALVKKHCQLQTAVKHYKRTILELADNVKPMKEQNNPSSDAVQTTQSHITKLYDSLEQLAEERAASLDESFKLFQLNREVEELESWINDQEIVAQSKELGHDFEHCEMIQEKFQEFARNTTATGKDRLSSVNSLAESLITSGHSEAVTIKEWKDGVGESWDSIQELIETRRKALATAYEMKRFYRDADDVRLRIQEKISALPDDIGHDVASVETLLRNHENFERDVAAIGTQLTTLSKEAARLEQGYPGDDAISQKQQGVEDAWETLQERTTNRKLQLKASDDLQKFLAAVKALLVWTGDMRMGIFTDEPAGDVRQAEVLIKEHQSRRAEIENREADFDAIAQFGHSLVDRSHFASKEIKAKLQLLVNEQNELWSDWNGRDDELRLFLEVHIFARDSHMADQWLNRLEQFLAIESLGDSLDDVDSYLKKHTDLLKSLDAQEERFLLLDKATEFEERQKAFQRDRVFSITGAGELSNRQPVAAGYIAERIERIEQEARAAPIVQKTLQQIEIDNELQEVESKDETSVEQESEDDSHRFSMIIHSDAPSDRSSGPVMSEEIDRALDREIHVKALSSDESIHARAEAIVSSVMRDAEKDDAGKVVRKVDMSTEVSNALQDEHKPKKEGKKVIQSSAKMPFLQDFKLQAITTINVKAHCPEDATRFWFRLMADEENVAFDMTALFNEKHVVLSSKVNGQVTGETRAENFPFVQGTEFELKVVVDEESYRVLVNGNDVGSLCSCMELSAVTKLLIGGDPDGKGSIVLLGLNAKVKRRGVAGLAKSSVVSKSDVPAPVEDQLPLDHIFEDTKEEESTKARLPKHVSFSDDFPRDGTSEDKAASPVPQDDETNAESAASSFMPAGGLMEGLLSRKHEFESAGKKSHTRSWKTFYVVLKSNQLIFYKDERDAIHSHHAAVPPIALEGSQCGEASDYTKKKHCLRLRTNTGGEWLFQAKNSDVMKSWIRAVDQSQQLSAAGDEQRTLPLVGTDVQEVAGVVAGSLGSSPDTTPLQSPSHVPAVKTKMATDAIAVSGDVEPKKEKRRSIFGRKK